MGRRRRSMWIWPPLLALALAGAVPAQAYNKPKVRAPGDVSEEQPRRMYASDPCLFNTRLHALP